MPTAEEFDEFYVSTRRSLVLTTFALTGDLAASRSAVRDAYVAARHHWDKVGRAEDPESWTRPRAWSAAQRRHTVRPWHRERQVTPEQAATLEALHHLPDSQRRTLVLSHLTELSLDAIGRELGQPLPKVEELFDAATATVAAARECRPEEIGALLNDLGPAADGVKLPRPPIIRRNGLRRRRNHAVVGSMLLAATTIAAGSFVAIAVPVKPGPTVGELVGKRMLLSSTQVSDLAPKGTPWTATVPNKNTEGSGKHNPCQQSRFADDKGLGTWVSTFVADGKEPRKLVQTVDISASPGAARDAYNTTLRWYAGCTAARVQIVDAYSIDEVGEQAQVLRLRIPARRDRAYVVALARTGALTTSTVLETRSSEPASAKALTQTLAVSVRNLCSSRVAGECVGTVKATATRPPRTGETPGTLANVDLPVIPRVNYPWVGTDPQNAAINPAATTCDSADFKKAGSANALTRSYLFPPEADLPRAFGLTETIGKFGSTKSAIRFVDRIIARMKACPDRELSSTISESIIRRGSAKESTYALWRLKNQLVKSNIEVRYWMGITRVGAYVSQVTMSPVSRYDVDAAAFRTTVKHARDRLYEVAR